MIGVDRLIEKLNTLISAGSLTELEVTQLSKVVDTLEKKGVSSVLNASYLPAPSVNKGRLFWLQTEQRYVYSNGAEWSSRNFYKESPNIYSWGLNNSFQLGDNTTSNRSSPVSVVGGIEDWVSVSGSKVMTGNLIHVLAIRANGTLWAWGVNYKGALGDGTTSTRSSPVSVIGGFSNWIGASAGNYSSIGLQSNGTLWSWGRNAEGQLGTNNTTSRSSPGSVVGGITDWVFAVIGQNTVLGIRANGVLYGWGQNNFFQVGDTTTSNRSSPVIVVGGFTDWISAGVGLNHSCGLRANGTLWAWGRNDAGYVGDGTTSSRSSPVSVVGGYTDWVNLSVGPFHNLAIRANGTMWAWGSGYYGQLGDNTTSNRSSPVSVVGGFADWLSASAGRYHSLGVRANGTLWSWGRNTFGQLGTNNTTSRNSPGSIVGGFTDWISATSADSSSFGIRA